MVSSSEPIPASLLMELKRDLCERQIVRGMVRLDRSRELIDSIGPRVANSAVLLGYLTQWVDVGYAGPPLLRELLSRFSRESRAGLTITEYIHLRLSEALVAMSGEAYDDAIVHLDVVSTLGEETDSKELLIIADFWKGRCLRKKGEYDRALATTTKGRELGVELGQTRMISVLQILEGWLLFQKGSIPDAIRILREAERSLAATDDYISLGNIQSTYGRIARREGRYQQAIEYFTRAITLYKQRDPTHRNVARSLTNLAFAKRQTALELRKKLDRDLVKRRRATGRNGNSQARVTHRRRLEELRAEAFLHLDEASEIYRIHPNHHGVATVHLNRGYLALDNGEVDLAEREAAEAFHVAEETDDSIIMTRARLLQCMAENLKLEEEIGESIDPGSHARRALEFAKEATEFAKRTQNRRLLANAHLWTGLTWSNSFFDDSEAARECCDQAIRILKESPPDYMQDDLRMLKRATAHSGAVHPTLRAWCQGSLGNKTFQQITEDFADLIIPKVWEREGRKVSRVAEKLSISPKKVRRILHRLGKLK